MLFIALLFAFCLCLPPQCEDFPWLYQFPFQLTTHGADEVRSAVYRKKGTAHSGWMDGLTVQQEASSDTNTSTNFFFPLRVKGGSQTEERWNMDTAEKHYPASAPGEATGWTYKNLGFKPRKKQEILLFSETLRRPSQLSVQTVLCQVAGVRN
jgi:hypothetical protein